MRRGRLTRTTARGVVYYAEGWDEGIISHPFSRVRDQREDYRRGDDLILRRFENKR